MKELRKRTCRFMLDNPEQFQQFLLNKENNIMSNEEYVQYCEKIGKTNEWGSQLELSAIASLLEKKIRVFQQNTTPLQFFSKEENSQQKWMNVSFHRHYYSLGYHYNSLIPSKN